MSSIISIKKLSKEYQQPDGQPLVVLRDLECQISSNSFTSIIGNSGCGKSTFLNILGLLDVPTRFEELVIAGSNINDLSLEERTLFRGKNIGFIFQFHQLLPEFTALQNVILPMRLTQNESFDYKERAMHLLESVFTTEEMNNKVYLRKQSQLSGGQCQRVAIARSLANDPSLVLADEPTGSLDEGSAEKVLDILLELPNRGKTVLMITHQLHLAYQADVVYRIENGQLHQQDKSLSEENLKAFCPACNDETALVFENLNSTPILRCPQCRGGWLSEKKLHTFYQ